MIGMWRKVQSQAGWVVAGCGLALAGALLMARAELNRCAMHLKPTPASSTVC
jgi:hypothetical protein